MTMTIMHYILMALSALLSIVAVYFAVIEKDLVRAVIYSALQSTLYALITYLIMAPDIFLTYIPVSVGLYTALVLILIKKTERIEGDNP
ncbi:MAG: hydrogenase subunit MbhD domain-containing protein [Ignisphaera sp.]